MHYIKSESYAQAYHDALDLLVNQPDYVTSPRGFKINECLDVSLEISDTSKNLFLNDIRGIPMKYLKNEFMLYLSGTRDASLFSQASKFWSNLATENKTINSAYGYLIFQPLLKDGRSQFDWVIDSLIADKDSRQAVMFYNRPEFQYPGDKDFVCTLNNIFHIRDNKLSMNVNMSSNDIFRGTTFDIPFFMLIHHMVYEILKLRKYPDLEIGSFIHSVSSLHLYYNLTSKSDIEIAKEMLKHPFISSSFDYPDEPQYLIMSNDIFDALLDPEMKIKGNGKNEKFIAWLNSK